MNGGGNLEEPIPRVAVKKISARTSHEAKRKEDMELRWKRLTGKHTYMHASSWYYMYNPCMVPFGRILDRIENNHKCGAATNSGADDALIVTAQLKAQKVTADR